MQYFAEDTQVAAVVFWTFGDLGRVTYRELPIIAIVTAASAVFFMLNRWNYNAMESGEGSAHGLGVNVNRVRLSNMLIGTLVSATVIAFCGTINLIGLVAPHIMRRILGSDYRYLLPASAIAGAVVLLPPTSSPARQSPRWCCPSAPSPRSSARLFSSTCF